MSTHTPQDSPVIPEAASCSGCCAPPRPPAATTTDIPAGVGRSDSQSPALGAGSAVAVIRVPEIDCQDEVKAIARALDALDGVVGWQANLLERTLRIQFDPHRVSGEEVLAAIRALGMTPVLASQAAARAGWRRDPLLLSTAASGLLLGGAVAMDWLNGPPLGTILLSVLTMLTGGWMTAGKAFRAVRARRLDMNALMTIAVLGAVGIGQWAEGASVVFLFALAQLLETYSLDRARQAVRHLLDVSPPEATVRRDGQEVRVPAATVSLGEMILVRPGERIALDGVVRAGSSGVNQAPITGESMPLEKAPGDQVYAGSINGAGSLDVEVTHRAQETVLVESSPS
jgi:Cd2+/Zn2+-exporting ATPase